MEASVDKEMILSAPSHTINGFELSVADAAFLNPGDEHALVATGLHSSGGGASTHASSPPPMENPLDNFGSAGATEGVDRPPYSMEGSPSSTPLKKGGYTTSGMNEDSNRVFVTRISEELTKEDLEAYFCQFGELTDIFVPLKNPNSDIKDGQHKGT